MPGEPFSVDPTDKQIAKHLGRWVTQQTGKRPRIARQWKSGRERFIDILSAEDCPRPGLAIHATVGLSKFARTSDRDGLELMTTCRSTFTEAHRGLAHAAWELFDSGPNAEIGTILPDTLPMYRCWSLMRHYLLAPPEDLFPELAPLTLGDRQVVWIACLPITDGERQFAREQGPMALRHLLDRESAALEDFNRPSVV